MDCLFKLLNRYNTLSTLLGKVSICSATIFCIIASSSSDPGQYGPLWAIYIVVVCFNAQWWRWRKIRPRCGRGQLQKALAEKGIWKSGVRWLPSTSLTSQQASIQSRSCISFPAKLHRDRHCPRPERMSLQYNPIPACAPAHPHPSYTRRAWSMNFALITITHSHSHGL